MAQSQREIKRRIHAVQNIGKITGAMELIAATKLRKAQRRAETSRPYLAKLEESLRRIMVTVGQEGDELPPIARTRPGNRHCLVVITADRGLAGGYNAGVLRRADSFLREHPDTQMVLIGRKARDHFRKKGVDFLAEYVNLGDEVTFQQAQEIGQVIQDFYNNDFFDRVQILYTRFVSTVDHRVEIIPVLPLGEVTTDSTDQNRGAQALYFYEPSIGEVLTSLVPLYIQTRIFQSLVEASASEQGARMTAMHSATENAEELVKELDLSFNRARQASITTEISEIVGGAEALGS